MKYILTLALISVLLSGCGGKEYSFTVRNLTGVGISSVYIRPQNSTESMAQVLEEVLEPDTEITVKLGRLGEDDTKNGFVLEVYSAEDGSSQDLSQLHIPDGGRVTFYLDDWGLAAAVDMTDEEVMELKESDHRAYLEANDEPADGE